MYHFWSVVLTATSMVGLFLTFLGLPGNWLIVIGSVTFAFCYPEYNGRGISWWVVAFLVLLAVLAEVLETVASAAGIHRGGSRLGAILAILGSFIGGLGGATVGLPIPIVGPIVGVFLFSSLGAMLGAMLGEIWRGKSQGEIFKISTAAFWGRLLGGLAKIGLGALMVIILITALFFV